MSIFLNGGSQVLSNEEFLVNTQIEPSKSFDSIVNDVCLGGNSMYIRSILRI